MATTINTIIRQWAIRVNGIAGSVPADVEAAYVVTPLTSVDSADFPLSFARDTYLAVESRLATAIASYRDPQTRALHPWRSLLKGVTAGLANKADIPSVDASGNQIIGVLGAVRDASDNIVCDEMPIDDVRRAARNANAWVVTPVYGYSVVGNRIEHTRTNVVVEVCTYNRTTRATAAAALTNNILLPDALEEAYVAGMVSLTVRDDAFSAQAALNRTYYREAISQLERGQVPGLAAAA